MILGSFSARSIGSHITSGGAGAIQYLSAGIILGAITGEIFPLITASLSSVSTYLGLIGGFALGVAANLMLSNYLGEIEDSMDEGADHGDDGGATSGDEEGTKLTADEGGKSRTPSGTRMRVPSEDGSLGELMTKLAPGVFDATGPPVPYLMAILAREAKVSGDRDVFDHAIHELEFVLHTLNRALRYRRRGVSSAKWGTAEEVQRMQEHLSELQADLDALSDLAPGSDAHTALKRVEGTLAHIHGHVERPFRRWAIKLPPAASPMKSDHGGSKLSINSSERAPLVHRAPVPWSLVFTVSIDAVVDGFLIGLTAASDPTAGIIMAAATCFEMGGLGVSFALALFGTPRNVSPVKMAAILMFPPLMMTVMAIGGAAVGRAVVSQVRARAGCASVRPTCCERDRSRHRVRRPDSSFGSSDAATVAVSVSEGGRVLLLPRVRGGLAALHGDAGAPGRSARRRRGETARRRVAVLRDALHAHRELALGQGLFVRSRAIRPYHSRATNGVR